MKKIILITTLLIGCPLKHSPVKPEVKRVSAHNSIVALVRANGFVAHSKTVLAIIAASKAYNVKPTHLAAIAIVETGFGRYARTRLNRNGTIDRGVFQINSVNNKKCAAFNLDTVEGNAFCAALILSHIPDVASYHSRTPTKKMIYSKKIAQVLKTGSDEYNNRGETNE
jgi:hypothetical protein